MVLVENVENLFILSVGLLSPPVSGVSVFPRCIFTLKTIGQKGRYGFD